MMINLPPICNSSREDAYFSCALCPLHKKQHNITEFPSLSGDSKRVCEHVGKAELKKATDSFEKCLF